MATISEAVGWLTQLRTQKALLDAEYKEKIAPINDKIQKIECALLAKMQKEGVDSYKTGHGTVYKSMRTSVSCPDKSAFMDYIKKNNYFELLEVRPLKTAIEEFNAGHGFLPPGVDYSQEVKLNFRKA